MVGEATPFNENADAVPSSPAGPRLFGRAAAARTEAHMEKAIEQAVGRVIETMRENLGEQLTVDDMARTAMFSKFHFSRFFQRVTGVSPGRLLSAMRLQEAKHL